VGGWLAQKENTTETALRLLMGGLAPVLCRLGRPHAGRCRGLVLLREVGVVNHRHHARARRPERGEAGGCAREAARRRRRGGAGEPNNGRPAQLTKPLAQLTKTADRVGAPLILLRLPQPEMEDCTEPRFVVGQTVRVKREAQFGARWRRPHIRTPGAAPLRPLWRQC
jgi:hypothetical protein